MQEIQVEGCGKGIGYLAQVIFVTSGCVQTCIHIGT